MYRIIETHDLHDFFETQLFLVYYSLTQHSYGIHEWYGQAEWHHVLYHLQEVVVCIAGIRHLIYIAARLQYGLVRVVVDDSTVD